VDSDCQVDNGEPASSWRYRMSFAARNDDSDSRHPRQWYRGGLNREMRVNQFKPSQTSGRPISPAGDDPMMDFRARLVHQQAEAAERRRLDLAEQSSRLKTAEERIRIWERIHEVTLPRDSAHNLVEIIAANTGLTEADVREEQQRRAALRAATTV
jgi:hypothetical protein